VRGREVVLAVVLGLGSTGSSLAGGGYEAGRRAYLDGDYATAYRLWLESVRGDDPDPLSAVGLGVLRERGLGVARSPAQALEWYRFAAERGVAEAAYQVGLMFELGIGVEPDPWAAEAWYAQALGTGEERCPGEMADPGTLIEGLAE